MTAVWLVAALCAADGASSGAPAITDRSLQAALAMLDRDPPISEVQRAALDYFRVSEDDLSGYRAAARLRALMPSLSGSYARDDGKQTTLSSNQIEFPGAFDADNPQITTGESDVGRAYSASVTWNLSGLIFDSNQLEAYALVGIQEDVVKEVTRLYYTRQHNLLTLALAPPEEPRAKVALMLRTRELEAMLDAMTGGAWSRMKRASDGGASLPPR